MDAAREITSAFASIEAEKAEEELRARRRAALAITATIRSGTRDDELTPEQAAALDEYEEVTALLHAMR